jgi:hypothetical protein
MRGTYVLLITAALGAGCGSGVSVSSAVKLENATAHLMSQGTCPTTGGALAPCTAYELTFAVSNGAKKAIDRLEDIALWTGGEELQNATAVSCGTEPWTQPAGDESSVVSVYVTFGPNASLTIPCDTSSVTVDSGGTALLSAPSAAGDSFDVKVEGLLIDAQPFMATAHAPIL